MSELLKKLDKAILECFTVRNEKLPEELRDGRYVYESPSLAEILKKLDKRDASRISDAKKLKAEKLRRVGLYREQMQSNDKIEYVDIDEHKLYNNEMRFAKYCPQVNLEEDE
jgi:hypothetical protein